MGVCCSKGAKPISTSSHYVSVISSPSLFPTEGEYKLDSAVASHAEETFSPVENEVERARAEDFKEQRSKSRFIETDAFPMRVDLCEETAKQTEKESLENVSEQTRGLAASVERCDEDLEVSTEDADSKVMATDLCYAGERTRLKKKDSIRQPKYKDEIMLSENIDSIVEKEIPEISDEESALEKDVNYILNDDITAADSNGPTSPSSGVRPRPSKEMNGSEADNKTTQESSPGALPTPKSLYRKRNKKQLSKDKQEGDLTSSPSVATSPLEKNVTQDAIGEEKIDRYSVPTPPSDAAPKAKRNARRKLKRQTNSGQEVRENHLNATTVSNPSQVQNDSLTNLVTQEQPMKHPQNGKEITGDEKLEQDIDYILSDDVVANESSMEVLSGKVSPAKKVFCRNESSSSKKVNDKGLEEDIDFILSVDFNAAVSNKKVSDDIATPLKRQQKDSNNEHINMNDKNEQKDIDNISSKHIDSPMAKGDLSNDSTPESFSLALSPNSKPKRFKYHPTSEKEVKNEHKLEDDIAFILNDDNTTAESNGDEEVSAENVSPKRKVCSPKKSTVGEKKCTDDKRLEEPNSQMAPSDVLPKKRFSFQETNQADDNLNKDTENVLKNEIVEDFSALKHCKQAEALEKDFQYILNDDTFTAESNDDAIFFSPSELDELPRPKTSDPKRALAMDMVSNLDPILVASPNQVNDVLDKDIAYILSDNSVDVASCWRSNKRKTSKRKTKKKTPHKDKNSDKSKNAPITEDTDSSANIYFDSGYSVVPRSSKNSSCEQKRAKIENSKLQSTKGISSAKSTASHFKVGAMPSWKTEKVNWDEAIDNILGMSSVDSGISGENMSDAGKCLRSEKTTGKSKQSKHTEEDNFDEAINEILEIPKVDTGASGENAFDDKTRSRKEKAIRRPQKAKQIEDVNLDEAINEILDIPITDSGASRENVTDARTSLRKNPARQPKQPMHIEKDNLEEAINEILEIPTVDGDSKKAMKLGAMSKAERKTKARNEVEMFESRDTDTAHTLPDDGVPDVKSPDVKYPDAKTSLAGFETKNSQSGGSVSSRDNMRPMAAGSSRIESVRCSASDTVTLSSSNTTRQVSKRRQTLPATLKKETATRKPRMAACGETAVPSLGSGKSMSTQRKPTVPVTDLNSHRTASGITYEFDEVMLMEEIERES